MTLVIMAAGLASRYGSTKQLEGVGPSGELLLEYSICDARRAGFTRVVFIVRQAIEAEMREFARRLPPDLQVDFDGPVAAVAPGQAAVFYDGDRVLGGAWIERTLGAGG